MCDDMACDGCDGDCCDSDCCCTPSEAAPGSNVEQDCLFYLCCAGCFLCPLFYVGAVKKVEEPSVNPVESARAIASTNNDDVTVAATALTSELANDPETTTWNVGVPLTTVIMDHENSNSAEQNDPIASTPPMDRK